jgi:hypothetical protein
MLATLLVASALFATGDADADGLDDAWEQQIIERFAPRLILSEGECDHLPAEFAPNEPHPRPVARNGTVYAKATPWTGRPGAWVEIHYYHLWANDCGRLPHPLDVERVSVLLTGPAFDAPPEQWRAVYWFAAAHEGTVCDGTHGARAEWLRAEMGGATVWVSRGKHASYLARSRCGKGCGGDQCKPQRHAVAILKLINVGEPDAPLNGALWTASPKWPMRAKMETDFTPAVVARLSEWDKKKAASMHNGVVPLQSVILGGEHTLRSLETAGNHTDNALGIAAESTGSALKKSFRAVGRALGVARD